MKLNFKYYNSGALIVLILVLGVIYAILAEWISTIVTLSDPLKERLSMLNEYVGWLSPVAFIGLVVWLINNWLWRYPFMKWLINIPDLNGRYKGTLVSSFLDGNGSPVEKDCVMEIRQNASSIHIYTYYANKGTNVQTSMAYSVAEEIVKEKNGSFSLYYLFANEPDGMLDALNKHNGTAKFIYLADKKQLVGEYYNHRLNKGNINLVFEGKELLHRFEK